MMDARTKLAIEKLSAMHLETLHLLREITEGIEPGIASAVVPDIGKAIEETKAFNEALKGM